MFSKIIVNSPWYLFLLSLVVAAGLSVWLYFKNRKNSEAPLLVQRALLVLRFLSTALVTLLLLTILFKNMRKETENPILLIAIDNSGSMLASRDSSYIRAELLPALKELKDKLSEKFTLRTVLFGSGVKEGEVPDFEEKETDLQELLSVLQNNYANQNVGALILLSDGIYNKGANPIYSSQKAGFPIYTVAVGDTNETKDVQIQKINHNEVVYAGNNFPVEVVVKAKKYKGKEVLVKLLRKGKEAGLQRVKINSDGFLTTCTFTLNSEEAGILSYSAMVSLLEGETNTLNNVHTFVVEAIDHKEKIALLAGAPHPDISAIKEVLAANLNYEVETGYSSALKKPLKSYDLVIIHGYSSGQNDLVNECRNLKVPFWLIHPKTRQGIPGINLSGTSTNQYDQTEPYLNSTFGLFTMSDGFRKFANKLPAISSPLGFYPPSNGSASLFKQRVGVVETENPILFFSELNGLKCATFLGDGLWRWKLRDFAEHRNNELFSELISKTVQYLSVKSDKSFFRIKAPVIIHENQLLEFGAELYNKSYELITEPDITMTINNSKNEKFNYTFNKAGNSYHLNAGLLSPGEYKYEASVKANDEMYVKRGIFRVKEVMNEKINTVANHQVLYQLSHRSGAKMYGIRSWQNLEKELLQSDHLKPITYVQSTTSSLIELKMLFWIILAVLTIEWYFRKRYLSI